MSLLQHALNEINNLNSGEEFLVRDLFVGYEWKRLSIEERQLVGRLFGMESQNPHLANGTISPVGKKEVEKKAKVQLYRKN